MPSDEVMLAALGVLNLALLVWQERTRRTAARAHGEAAAAGAAAREAKEQVANDHSTNLREELDERHSETMSTLERLEGTLSDLGASDRRQWRYINELLDARRTRRPWSLVRAQGD